MNKQASSVPARSDETEPVWVEPVGVALVLLLVALLVIGIYPGWGPIGLWMDKADSPAWVQAVGSILAIAFSAVFVVVQHKLEIQRQRQADIELRLRKLSVIVQLAHAMKHVTVIISQMFTTLENLREQKKSAALPVQEMVKFHTFLDALPLHEMDSGEVVQELIMMQNNCRQFSRILEKVVENAQHITQANFDLARGNMTRISGECTKSVIRLLKNFEDIKSGSFRIRVDLPSYTITPGVKTPETKSPETGS